MLTFIDITDRRRAEEELRAGEAHLKLLAQSTKGYAIITLDCDGLITTWNCGAELILGYRETEVLGQTVDIIYTEQDRQAGVPEAERQRALQHGQATDERWHARRDGSRCFLSGLLNPLVDGTGKSSASPRSPATSPRNASAAPNSRTNWRVCKRPTCRRTSSSPYSPTS